MKSALDWINQLNLLPHPEGGYYQRIYTASKQINGQATASAIHYLLEGHDFSAWHRIKQDELWFFHDGTDLVIHQLSPTGELLDQVLGKDHHLSVMVPANTWFSAETCDKSHSAFSLVSCVVTPEFRFEDFELGNKEELVNLYPRHRDLICELCRE